jgi:endoglucanase
MRRRSTTYVVVLTTTLACSYDASKLAGPPDVALADAAEPGTATGGVLGTGGFAGTGGGVGSGGAAIASGGTAGGGTTGTGGQTTSVPASMTGGMPVDAASIGTGGLLGSGGVRGSGGVAATGGSMVDPVVDAAVDTAMDSATDAALPSGCSYVTGGSLHTLDTTGAVCIATSDTIQGWGCSNFTGRTVTVNGIAVQCGGSISKVNGYYIFQISSGTLEYAGIYWY